MNLISAFSTLLSDVIKTDTLQETRGRMWNIKVWAEGELILMRPTASIPPSGLSGQGKAFVGSHSSLFLVAKQDRVGIPLASVSGI